MAGDLDILERAFDEADSQGVEPTMSNLWKIVKVASQAKDAATIKDEIGKIARPDSPEWR